MVKPADNTNQLLKELYEIDIDKLKSIVNIIQSILVSFGIIFGAIWFLVRAEYGYRANVDLDLTIVKINAERMLGSVEVKVKNNGKRIIDLRKIKFIVEQILPLWGEQKRIVEEQERMLKKGQEFVDWLNIREIPPRDGSRPLKRLDYVKPDEEANIYFEFEISNNIDVIQIYVFVDDEGRKNEGWQKRKIFVSIHGGSPSVAI